MTHVADLRPYMKNINCKFIVLRKSTAVAASSDVAVVVEDPKPAKDGGIVHSFQVADGSASVIANFWNEIGAAIRVGDILLIAGGMVTMFRNCIRVACKLGTVIRMGKLRMIYSDSVDVSKPVWLPNPDNPQELVKQEDKPKGSGTKKRLIPS